MSALLPVADGNEAAARSGTAREVGPALTPRQFDNLDRRYWNKYLNSTKDKR